MNKLRVWIGSRSRGLPLPAALIVLGLAIPADAGATIETLQVEPAQPTCAHEVVVTVAGFFPDGCWSVSGIEKTQHDNIIEMEVLADDSWDPTVKCSPGIVPYARGFNLGTLDAGNYTLSARESVISQRSAGDSRTIAFSVVCVPQECDVDGLLIESQLKSCNLLAGLYLPEPGGQAGKVDRVVDCLIRAAEEVGFDMTFARAYLERSRKEFSESHFKTAYSMRCTAYENILRARRPGESWP